MHDFAKNMLTNENLTNYTPKISCVLKFITPLQIRLDKSMNIQIGKRLEIVLNGTSLINRAS